MKMNNTVILPLAEPVYSTYHYQGGAAGLLYENPSLRNWYLNNSMILHCGRQFLKGMTTPLISIMYSSIHDLPGVTKKWYGSEHLKGHINVAIRSLLDDGYYVNYSNVDDFYIKSKSWYHERHFNHDGLICGYDQKNSTFRMYAYDSGWIYREFDTPQSSFNRGRAAAASEGAFCIICGIKVGNDEIVLDPKTIYQKLKEYLDSSVEKYPVDKEGDVFGIAVHDYIAMYVAKLYDGSIPYERMDRRVFRLLWEHKKVMLERMQKVEEVMGLDSLSSEQYKDVVHDMNTLRMQYASYHMKKRDSLLPVIQKNLYAVSAKESEILHEFVEKMKGKIDDEIVE